MALHLINFTFKVAKELKESFTITLLSENDFQEKRKEISPDTPEKVSYKEYVISKLDMKQGYTDLIITNIVRI